MNLKNEFEKGIFLTEYKKLLGDQSAVYNRHYQKARIPEMTPFSQPPNILVITEPWCGDSSAILPVVEKIIESQPGEIRIVLRDENPGLMSRFLTNGGKAVPIFLILNGEGNLLGKFGPRPKAAQKIYEAHRQAISEGKIEKKEVIRKIRTFYAKDKGQEIAREFIHLLENIM